MVPGALEKLNDLSSQLTEAYKDYAFNWALEKQARAGAIQQAWSEGFNSSQTSDYAFTQSLDQAITTITGLQDIKALEHEYAHVQFLIQCGHE